MGDIATVVGLIGAVCYSLLNLLALVTSGEYMSSAKIGASYLIGVALIFVVAGSTIGSGLVLYGTTLGLMNASDKILIGIAAPALFGVVYDFKKAIDPNDSAVVPGFFKKN